MVEPLNEEDIWKAIAKVKYPAVDRTLVDLDLVKDIKVKGGKAILKMALPFPSSPIINKIVRSVKEPIEKLGLNVEINITLMSKEERETFLDIQKDSWKHL